MNNTTSMITNISGTMTNISGRMTNIPGVRIYKPGTTTNTPKTMTNTQSAMTNISGTMTKNSCAECSCMSSCPCTDGYILPVIYECTFSHSTRILLYLMGIIYCFVGIIILSDLFAMAIEAITATTKTIHIHDPHEGYIKKSVKIWNDTIRNLTLLSMANSAPEIVMALEETLVSHFRSQKICFYVIIGSAAFNLFVITSLCIVAVPKDEVRVVRSFRMYILTGVFNVFAFVWMGFVLLVWSPAEVSVIEATITFLYFPLLVSTAYYVDRLDSQAYNAELPFTTTECVLESMNEKVDKMVHLINEASCEGQISTKIQDAKTLLRSAVSQNKAFGGNRDQRKSILKWRRSEEVAFFDTIETDSPTSYGNMNYNPDCNTVSLIDKKIFLKENAGTADIRIIRIGDLSKSVKINLSTEDGTALEKADYEPVNKVVTFNPIEDVVTVSIPIVDDLQAEPNKYFSVELSTVPGDDAVVVGRNGRCVVVIIDNDEAGWLSFTCTQMIVESTKQKVSVPVERTGGEDGIVQLFWETRNHTAIEGEHYIGKHGSVLFDNGQTEKNIEIQLISENIKDTVSFQLNLMTTQGGASIGSANSIVIKIMFDQEFSEMVHSIRQEVSKTLHRIQVIDTTYADNFRMAMNVNQGNLPEATALHYVLHGLTFFWKVLFAFIPPTKYLHGWLTFMSVFVVLSLVMLVVGDLARILSCLMDIDVGIIAISLVAVGTSVPELSASYTNARHAVYADISIGNTHSSNAVNVFVGMGISWILDSIFLRIFASDTYKFHLYPNSMVGLSVTVYSVLAVLTILLVWLRRHYMGGELGGPKVSRYLTAAACVGFWVVFVVVVTLGFLNVI